jgi:hypothetical protein
LERSADEAEVAATRIRSSAAVPCDVPLSRRRVRTGFLLTLRATVPRSPPRLASDRARWNRAAAAGTQASTARIARIADAALPPRPALSGTNRCNEEPRTMASFTLAMALMASALVGMAASPQAQFGDGAKVGDEKKSEPPNSGPPCTSCEDCAHHSHKKVQSTGKLGERLPSVTALVVRGEESSELDTAKLGKPTVFLLVGASCPVTRSCADRIVSLEKAYSAKGVDFVLVYAGAAEDAQAKAAFHQERKFVGAFWNDEKEKFAKAIKANSPAEALLVGKEGKVRYRGAIDDSPGDAAKVRERLLGDALEQLLAEQVRAAQAESRGV